MRKTDFLFCNGLYLETALALRLSLFKGRSLVKIVGDPVWERAQNRIVPPNLLFSKLQSLAFLCSKIVERKLITWSLIQFDQVTCPGVELAKTVKNWSNKLNVLVVHNGAKISVKKEESQKIYDLIVVSRLVSWKNVDLAIFIANKLDCTLVIVGDGPQRGSLNLQADSNPKISFLGSCSNDEVGNLLRESRIFCQFSDYEGLSISLLQAMSNSLPCVLSNIDANRDVFNSDLEAAIFVNIKERDETASIVSSLLNSKTQQRDLGARARIIVEQEFNEKDKMREMKNLLIEND
jgi:glycosyltransferase involved in cell wall biosynthesis